MAIGLSTVVYRVMNLNSSWMKDLRTEVFRKMYELPIHPKNLWLDQDPLPHEKMDEIYRKNIRCLIKRGSFTEPATHTINPVSHLRRKKSGRISRHSGMDGGKIRN
jgi:hypothetical protein